MSAFVVGKVHIDALLTAGINPRSTLRWWREGQGQMWGELTRETADRVGAMLVAENVRSVRFRYPDINDDLADMPGPSDNEFAREAVEGRYAFERTQDMSAIAILKAINSYEYQACETEDWEQSEAAAFCRSLQAAMIHKLPDYDDAPWEITQRGVAPISLFEMARRNA